MAESISGRKHSIPVLYTRGTHFEVGFDMGRTFSRMIKEFLQVHPGLNQKLLPAYKTPEGERLYNESLARVRASFPQYLNELEGIAKGAEVDFTKLFLLHLGDLLPHFVSMSGTGVKTEPKLKMETAQADVEIEPKSDPTSGGCLNIIVNNYHNRYIAHTQDATGEFVNHIYCVVAHIISNEPQGKYKVIEEKFMSLCYAGHLPGFTMASNHHGIVYTINKLTPCTVAIGKTPPHFLGRALLSAENIEKAAFILNDEGVGAADGFSLSIASVNDRLRKCFIIEVAPAIIGATNSLINIGEIGSGTYAYHANKYMGLEVGEISNIFHEKSDERLNAVAAYDPPRTKESLLNILNDENIYLLNDSDKQSIRTIALGVFDLNERNFAIYMDPPAKGAPIFELPLIMKSDCRVFQC